MAAAGRKSVKLRFQFHKASGQFCKVIGRALGRDGLPRPKVFYLGADEADAISKLTDLRGRWNALVAAGKTVWDEEDAYLAQKLGMASAEGLNTAVSKAVMTVEHAAELYLADLLKQHEGGQFGRSHYESQRYRVVKGIEPIKQLPLSMVGEQQLQAAVLRLAQRPMMDLRQPRPRKAGRTPKQQKRRKMSATYAKATIATLKWLFRWLDESDLWDRPKRFDRLFKVRPVLDADEQHRQLASGAEVDRFTREELVTLWRHANDRQRLYIVLGLNCAFANSECATLRVSEVKDLGTPEARIERFRIKTVKTAGRGSFARWFLWPETQSLLLQEQAGPNPAGLFLLTEEGMPLTTNACIGQSWRRLLRTAKVRALTYKYLRKTAAHLVRNELGFGSEVADMMLAHAESGIIKHYAGRDWQRLRAATDAMRGYLATVFTGTPSAPVVTK